MKYGEGVAKWFSNCDGGKRCEFGVSVMKERGGLLTVVFREQRKVKSMKWWWFGIRSKSRVLNGGVSAA
jgi:hypothetical protein